MAGVAASGGMGERVDWRLAAPLDFQRRHLFMGDRHPGRSRHLDPDRPVPIVITTSFTTSQTLRFPPPDFSLRWYRELFYPARSAQVHIAAFNSVWFAGNSW